MSTEIRCVSGLHLLASPGNCAHCRKIRNAIWNSSDPRSTQNNFNLKCADALDAAAKFVAHRTYLQHKADIALALLSDQRAIERNKAKQDESISKRRAQSQNMRAKQLRAEGLLSHDLLDRLYKLQKGKCPCCKRALGKDFHMDHIVALANGGTNTDNNIQLLRDRCNLTKSTMDPILFMQINGFLI